MGTSLASDSASSAGGSDAATTPQPANSRTRRGSSGSIAADRRAMPHSPSPSAPNQPTGPAYRARSMPSMLRISSRAADRRGAADGGRRVQGGGERERRRVRGVAAGRAEHARDVGREVQDVRQVQHERHVGHVGRGAERLQRVRHGRHGVLVLLEVLRRVREDRRPGEVRRVVAGAPDGPREHARGDQALLGPDQQLGRRAHHAVDAERPARRVLHGEPLEGPPHVDGVLGAGVHVAREDDLLHVAGLDGGDAPGDDVTPAVRADGAVGVDDRAGVDGRHARADDVRQPRGGAQPGARR